MNLAPSKALFHPAPHLLPLPVSLSPPHLMRLDLLLERIEVVSVRGDTSRVVLRVSEDSRDVDWQTAFVAVEGAVVDGHCR